MIQKILVGILFLAAIAFIVKKFFWKKKTAKACGEDNCGCS
ncbi:FeoB-associated Cys-rich membrane protein [Kordia sp. TARA_039_SRF]|nr:FeoB-associated Cys-rich membrane protein [Kordia sp. TARA_039_SRF]